ncbi:MAG: hypothetical protein IIT85_05725 [Prevotella sp.]|nr:hypothetical protein [Prevotella sp.]
MKKIVLICFMSLFAMFTWAQTANEAKKVLDKTASVVGRKGGASASFKVSSSMFRPHQLRLQTVLLLNLQEDYRRF